jgi:UDPglucose--hexose-1-phosphate uridylyltransferase
VAVAPNRRRRPGAAAGLIEPAGTEELEQCPFCAGREDRTPPETFRVAGPDGWLVRVVPNLYPAFDRQEVVVHSPRHVRTFAELGDAEVEAVAAAWAERARTCRRDGFPYLHALVNEGAASGSSLAHSHSQLVYLPEPPPAVLAERRSDGCAVCQLLAGAPQDLRVAERGDVVALAHPVGRLPYELLLAAPHGDLDLRDALLLLRRCVQALRTVEGPLPWNAWLHDGWQDGLHAHVELVPRLSVLAGVELGAGIYVNTVAPEDAAAALREAVDS